MPRRILEGNVVSNKTNKTITVLVERRFMHPVYKKYIKSTSKFTAHDEQNISKEGDRVQIIECRPISKTKRWAVLRDGVPSMPEKGNKESVVKRSAPKKVKPEKSSVDKKLSAKEKQPEKAKKPDAKKTKSSKKEA